MPAREPKALITQHENEARKTRESKPQDAPAGQTRRLIATEDYQRSHGNASAISGRESTSLDLSSP